MAILTEAQYEAITGLSVGTGGALSSSRFTALVDVAERQIAAALGYETLERTAFTDRNEYAGRSSTTLQLSGAPQVDTDATFTVKVRSGDGSLSTIDSSVYRIIASESLVELVDATRAIAYEDNAFTVNHYAAGLRPYWPERRGDVAVTYMAGYANDGTETPEHLKGMICEAINFLAHRSQVAGTYGSVASGGVSEGFRGVAEQRDFFQDLVRPLKRAGGYVS